MNEYINPDIVFIPLPSSAVIVAGGKLRSEILTF